MSDSVKGLNLIYISRNHKHTHVKKLEIIFEFVVIWSYGAERVNLAQRSGFTVFMRFYLLF